MRVPKGVAARPTQDRVREAIFNALGDRVVDAEVLDLFAGVGTLGIEALSRGARRAVFVELDPRTAAGLRANLEAAGLRDRGEVWRMDAVRSLRRLQERGDRFDLVFLDPPYRSGWLPRALRALAASGILGEGGLVVAEGARGEPLDAYGLEVVWHRTYGDTTVTFLRRAKGEDDGGGRLPGDV